MDHTACQQEIDDADHKKTQKEKTAQLGVPLDVILDLDEDESIPTSSFVISQLSPVLTTLLERARKEQMPIPAPPVTFKVTEHQKALGEILSNTQLHLTFNPKMIRGDNVVSILDAAIYADIKDVIRDCVNWLITDLKVESPLLCKAYCPYKLWEMACKFNLVNLQDCLVSANINWTRYVRPSSLPNCWVRLIERLSHQPRDYRNTIPSGTRPGHRITIPPRPQYSPVSFIPSS